MQCAQRQERRRQIRLVARDAAQLGDGVGEALRRSEIARIGHAHLGLDGCLHSTRLQVAEDDVLGLSLAGHQINGQQHRAHGRRLCAVCLARQRQGAITFACSEPAATRGHLRRHGQRRVGLEGLQHLVEHACRTRVVARLLHGPGQRGDEASAFGVGREFDQCRQRLGRVAQAIERRQDLHLHARCVQRIGQHRAPGPRCRQRLVTCAGLQGDVDRAAEELAIARAPRCVEDDLVGLARFTAAQFDFADE